jgi:hypothetical protein
VSKAAVVQFPEIKKTRLYYVDKKTNKQKRLSDNIFRDLQYVTRANDRSKKISLKARNLLTNLLQMILKNPHKEEFVDHAFLSQITEVSSSKQNARLLEQISDIIDFTYHSHIRFQEKIRAYGYVIKLTNDGYERAKNPLAFYGNLDGQKCSPNPTKMSSQVDKNVQIYKEEENPEEEINHSYANGFISEKEKIYKKEKVENELHATFAPCSLAQHEQVASPDEKTIELQRKQRSSENTGISSLAELMVKVLDKPEELPEQEEIPKMEYAETELVDDDKQLRKMLLSKALYGAFGEQRSGEIQDDYKFVEITPQKVCIQSKEMLLNDIEKAKIRKCIQSVYGADVTLAMQIITPEPTEEIQTTYQKSNLLDFKAAIPDRVTLNILTNRLVKMIEKPKSIIVEAAPFFIAQLTEAGNLTILEDAVVKTGITLELYYNKQTQSQNTIVLTPEKILKDREWLENHRKSLQE